jgi:hypothetical protein
MLRAQGRMLGRGGVTSCPSSVSAWVYFKSQEAIRVDHRPAATERTGRRKGITLMRWTRAIRREACQPLERGSGSDGGTPTVRSDLAACLFGAVPIFVQASASQST